MGYWLAVEIWAARAEELAPRAITEPLAAVEEGFAPPDAPC